MAKKRVLHSQLGSTLYAPKESDYMPVDVQDSSTPSGFRTKKAPLKVIGDLVYAGIRNDNAGLIYMDPNYIKGSGIGTDRHTLDPQFFKSRYALNNMTNISQIGDIRQGALPLGYIGHRLDIQNPIPFFMAGVTGFIPPQTLNITDFVSDPTQYDRLYMYLTIVATQPVVTLRADEIPERFDTTLLGTIYLSGGNITNRNADAIMRMGTARFSANGGWGSSFPYSWDTVQSVDQNDRVAVSVSSDGQTYVTTTQRVGTLTDQIKSTVSKEISSKVAASNGLVGSGSSASPIGIDSNWTDQHFYKNMNFPFSQVGGASDFTLPISGSYFSVSYPYFPTNPFPSTSFVESNGELRTLHHVTNGEQIRPVYALWPNYRNTTGWDCRLTDVVYNPPGLKSDEFIRQVYMSSSTAMVCEIWDSLGFKEWGFVELNNTFDHNNHNIIRMGINPFQTLVSGGTPSTSQLNAIRTVHFHAVIVKGTRYVLYCPPAGENGDWGVVKVAVVDTQGNVTQSTNWNCTNCAGWQANNRDKITMFNQVFSNNSSDTSAMYFNANPATITCWTNTGIDYAYITIGNITSDGKVNMVYRRYDVWNSNQGSNSIQADWYFQIDFANKQVTPHPDCVGQRPTVRDTGNGQAVVDQLLKFNDDVKYHFWAMYRKMQIVGDGARVYHTYTNGNLDIPNTFNTYFKASSPVGKVDILGSASSYNGGYVSFTNNPPTPIKSVHGGNWIYDRLVVNDQSGSGPRQYGEGVDCAVIGYGNPTKTYNLVKMDGGNGSTPVSGYELTSNRYNVSNVTPVYCFWSANGYTGVHQAFFTHASTPNDAYPANVNGDISTTGNYRISQTAIDAVNNWIRNIAKPNGFTDVYRIYWTLVPPYPGLGNDQCILKTMICFSKPGQDASGGYGFVDSGNNVTCSPLYVGYNVLQCSLDRNTSNGDVTLQNVTFNQGQTFNSIYYHNVFLNWDNSQAYTSCGAAVRMESDGTIKVLMSGGPAMFNYKQDGTTETNFIQPVIFKPWEMTCTRNSAVNWTRSRDTPTFRLDRGIGVVTAGLGAGSFYGFVPFNFDSMTFDENNIVILGSARPASGMNFTISGNIPMYLRGKYYEIPAQSFDLNSLFGSDTAKNNKFYLYGTIDQSNNGKLVISQNGLDERSDLVYIGSIATSATEISDIAAIPVTRWDGKRPSTKFQGSSIPVSTGTPNSGTGIQWVTPYSPEIVDSYWSKDPEGAQPISQINCGDVAYLIVKSRHVNNGQDNTINWALNNITNVEIGAGNVFSTAYLHGHSYNPDSNYWYSAYRVVTNSSSGKISSGVTPDSLNGGVSIDGEMTVTSNGSFWVGNLADALQSLQRFTLRYSVMNNPNDTFTLNGKALPVSYGLSWDIRDISSLVQEGWNSFSITAVSENQPPAQSKYMIVQNNGSNVAVNASPNDFLQMVRYRFLSISLSDIAGVDSSFSGSGTSDNPFGVSLDWANTVGLSMSNLEISYIGIPDMDLPIRAGNGFQVIITEQIPVVLNKVQGYLPPGTYNIQDLTGTNPAGLIVNMYIVVNNGMFSFQMSSANLTDDFGRTWIGQVTCNASGVVKVFAKPFSRMGTLRLSSTPRGKSVPCTTGSVLQSDNTARNSNFQRISFFVHHCTLQPNTNTGINHMLYPTEVHIPQTIECGRITLERLPFTDGLTYTARCSTPSRAIDVYISPWLYSDLDIDIHYEHPFISFGTHSRMGIFTFMERLSRLGAVLCQRATDTHSEVWFEAGEGVEEPEKPFSRLEFIRLGSEDKKEIVYSEYSSIIISRTTNPEEKFHVTQITGDRYLRFYTNHIVQRGSFTGLEQVIVSEDEIHISPCKDSLAELKDLQKSILEYIDCGYIHLNLVPSTNSVYYASTVKDRRMVILPVALYANIVPQGTKIIQADDPCSIDFSTLFDGDRAKITQFLSNVMAFGKALDRVDALQMPDLENLKMEFVYPYLSNTNDGAAFCGFNIFGKEEESPEFVSVVTEDHIRIKKVGNEGAIITLGKESEFATQMGEVTHIPTEKLQYVGSLTGLELFDFADASHSLVIRLEHKNAFFDKITKKPLSN
ncbi:hypothetical protein WH47_09778 [Habropoda laboriosa]|uniref:Uncharacterized protein n=1 Tax=Habropoda laboriosa TaxID=597456 RepID=A0A0L7QIZ4_9HYME|nr:hypothetical protein WH47_09778 [Habropoda laboriosa]